MVLRAAQVFSGISKISSQYLSVSLKLQSPHLLHVDLEGSLRLALGTRAGLHLLGLRLEERPQHKAALVAVVLDHAELREHAGAAADHPAGPDQLVQVELPGPQIETEGIIRPRARATNQRAPLLTLSFCQVSVLHSQMFFTLVTPTQESYIQEVSTMEHFPKFSNLNTGIKDRRRSSGGHVSSTRWRSWIPTDSWD